MTQWWIREELYKRLKRAILTASEAFMLSVRAFTNPDIGGIYIDEMSRLVVWLAIIIIITVRIQTLDLSSPLLVRYPSHSSDHGTSMFKSWECSKDWVYSVLFIMRLLLQNL